MATCPECDTALDIDQDEVEEGDVITCNECGTDYEVVTVEPLEIAAVDAEGYDDEDEISLRDEEEEDE